MSQNLLWHQMTSNVLMTTQAHKNVYRHLINDVTSLPYRLDLWPCCGMLCTQNTWQWIFCKNTRMYKATRANNLMLYSAIDSENISHINVLKALLD